MKKRIFISFAIENKNLRDLLIGQRNNEYSSIDFIDMSVKEPWSSNWKTQCRTKIKGCHGMIIILTKDSVNADGQIWEMKCAEEEGVPMIGLWGQSIDKNCKLPSEMPNIRIYDWKWKTISEWVDKL